MSVVTPEDSAEEQRKPSSPFHHRLSGGCFSCCSEPKWALSCLLFTRPKGQQSGE